jgi:membrane-associated HD superfamily phosphohydrolase
MLQILPFSRLFYFVILPMFFLIFYTEKNYPLTKYLQQPVFSLILITCYFFFFLHIDFFQFITCYYFFFLPMCFFLCHSFWRNPFFVFPFFISLVICCINYQSYYFFLLSYNCFLAISFFIMRPGRTQEPLIFLDLLFYETNWFTNFREVRIFWRIILTILPIIFYALGFLTSSYFL